MSWLCAGQTNWTPQPLLQTAIKTRRFPFGDTSLHHIICLIAVRYLHIHASIEAPDSSQNGRNQVQSPKRPLRQHSTLRKGQNCPNNRWFRVCCGPCPQCLPLSRLQCQNYCTKRIKRREDKEVPRQVYFSTLFRHCTRCSNTRRP